MSHLKCTFILLWFGMLFPACGPLTAETATNVNSPNLTAPMFFGGSKADWAKAIGFDSKGNIYIAGVTDSSDLPLKNPVQDRAAKRDVFVAKLSSDRKRILYATYLGGKGKDDLRGMAVDTDGHAWLTGTTSSDDFPLRNPIQRHSTGIDGFVVKLSPTGSLLFSSYLGGKGRDDFNSIAVDQKQNAYLTGRTLSIDFPTTKTFGATGTAFVMKINSKGHLVYSIRFGSGLEEGKGITVDQAGFVYLCGWMTKPVDDARNLFPITANAFDRSFNGGHDAFVMKLQPDGSQIRYSTYLGGVNSIGQTMFLSADRAKSM